MEVRDAVAVAVSVVMAVAVAVDVELDERVADRVVHWKLLHVLPLGHCSRPRGGRGGRVHRQPASALAHTRAGTHRQRATYHDAAIATVGAVGPKVDLTAVREVQVAVSERAGADLAAPAAGAVADGVSCREVGALRQDDGERGGGAGGRTVGACYGYGYGYGYGRRSTPRSGATHHMSAGAAVVAVGLRVDAA